MWLYLKVVTIRLFNEYVLCLFFFSCFGTFYCFCFRFFRLISLCFISHFFNGNSKVLDIRGLIFFKPRSMWSTNLRHCCWLERILFNSNVIGCYFLYNYSDWIVGFFIIIVYYCFIIIIFHFSEELYNNLQFFLSWILLFQLLSNFLMWTLISVIFIKNS